jgi:pimeloyl-[acyl-carrier protein] methyl ester esterase
MPQPVIRHRIAALLAVDESAALGAIRLPTLVLRARRDRVISRAATRWILKILPGARLVEIDGPHLLLQTLPAECAAIVLEFMGYSSSASSSGAPSNSHISRSTAVAN